MNINVKHLFPQAALSSPTKFLHFSVLAPILLFLFLPQSDKGLGLCAYIFCALYPGCRVTFLTSLRLRLGEVQRPLPEECVPIVPTYSPHNSAELVRTKAQVSTARLLFPSPPTKCDILKCHSNQ